MIDAIELPDPGTADEHGLVALGGDFSVPVLLAAYARGIFPWPSEELPRAWFSPDPRMLLRPRDFHLGRRLARKRRAGPFHVTCDRAFPEVIAACAATRDRASLGTWIVDELRQGFLELHALGLAHSVETWHGERLVGGLYGLSLGAMFCGESMFHLEADASKIALAALAERLEAWDFHFIDCQVYSEHLASLGAREVPRAIFLAALGAALAKPTRLGPWPNP